MEQKYVNRVELHCHTGFSEMAGIDSVRDIVKYAIEQGMMAVAFTDNGKVCAYPEIQHTTERLEGFKPIYGMEAYIVNDLMPCMISILVKNDEGRKNLYKLVTDSNLQYFDQKPRIPFDRLLTVRENLLLGSGCEGGELVKCIRCGKSDEELEAIARRYDYLEVMPVCETGWMLRRMGEERILSDDEIRVYNDVIIKLGEKLGIPVVATSNVYYLRPENAPDFSVAMEQKEGNDFSDPGYMFFRTTEEMLEEFAYLGKEKCYEIVIGNTNKIAEQIDYVKPLDLPKALFYREGDYERLEKLCFERVECLDGEKWYDDLGEAKERIMLELSYIKRNNTAYYYLYFYDLIRENHLNPAQYNLRGSGAGMLVNFLLGISHVNPLDPETPLYREFFIGFDGRRLPDIDINIDESVWPKVVESTKHLSGIRTAYHATTVSTVGEEKIGWRHYHYEVHPGKMILIPDGINVTDYVPLAMDEERKEVILAFDYHELEHVFEMLDILQHDNCTLNAKLYTMTGYYPTNEDIRSEELFSIPDIPEVINDFTLELIKEIEPKTFADLVRIEGLCHGSNTWTENADVLLAEGKATLREVISCREDVYEAMLKHGIEHENAYRIAEYVRKGKMAAGRMQKEYRDKMTAHGVPKWYIESCEKVRYLFPRAHAAEYVQMKLRSIYYKLHYPKIYDSLFREIYAGDKIRRHK